MSNYHHKETHIPAEMNTPAYKKLLQQCVHCGLCLESCPTYLLFGTEMDSPRGRIALMKAASDGRVGREDFHTVFRQHILLCLECRACESACPSGVEYGKLVEGALIALEKEGKPGWIERNLRKLGMAVLMPNIRLFKNFARLLRVYQYTGLQSVLRWFNILPWRIQNMANLLPSVTNSYLYPGGTYPAKGTKRGTVAFFTGCVQEAFLGHINAATVRVLQRNGYDVHIPAAQTCCGAAQWHTGDKDLAIKLAKQNLDAFPATDYDAIINNAGGCGLTLREYPDLLVEEQGYLQKAEPFAAKVMDFSQFLHDNLLEPPESEIHLRAVYSDSCHLRHGQKVIEAPRSLLQAIPGLELVEMKEPDLCCGSAGIYNITQPEPAMAILNAKLKDLETTGAQLIVTSNTGCHMQLMSGARKAGLTAHVLHIAEVLDYAYRAETRWAKRETRYLKPLRKERSQPLHWLAWQDKRKQKKVSVTKLSSLRSKLQPGQVLENELERLTYEQDASIEHFYPDGVVFPYRTMDVQQIVRWSIENQVPLIARGAGSGLAGNALAEHGGVILEFSQMKALLELDLESQTAVVQPGMVTQKLENLLQPHGYTYPPDPASGKVSTIGANISLNSGGPHCFKYGVTGNYVLGLEVVLPDGYLMKLGGKALDYPEYDISGLITGSEGTLGIITQATLGLKKRTQAVKTMMAAFDSLEQAGDAVSAIISRGLVPATLELMDQRMMRMVEDFVGAGLPVEAAAALILETDGHPNSVDAQMEEIVTVLKECGVKEMQVAQDEAQREKIWYARKSSAGAVARVAPGEHTVDATVPRSKIAQTLKEVRRICEEAELQVAILAHAGDGNLHPMLLIPDLDDHELISRVIETARKICDYCTKIDGSITGEHGVGIEKRDFMTLMYTQDEMDAMREIKTTFDPQNILNPGKVIPKRKAEKEITREMFAPKDIFLPRNTEEAAQGIRGWADLSKPIRIHSSKSAMENNHPGGETALFTQNMIEIQAYHPDDLYVHASAGVRLQALQKRLAEDNMWLPLNTPWEDATLGSLVATNSNAPLRMRYGSLRDLVLAMTVVLPDGRILRLGRPVVKNVAGYDLSKLFIGSFGTLGLISELTFKIMPLPRQRVTRMIPIETLSEGFAMGEKVIANTITGSAVMLAKGLALKEQSSPYFLVYTLEGYSEDVQAELEILNDLLQAGPGSLQITQSGSEVWSDWIRHQANNAYLYRIGFPASHLPRMIESKQIKELEGSWIADLFNGLVYCATDQPLEEKPIRIIEDAYAVLMSAPPPAQEKVTRWIYQPSSFTLMQKIKNLWDPSGMFNPGEFIL